MEELCNETLATLTYLCESKNPLSLQVKVFSLNINYKVPYDRMKRSSTVDWFPSPNDLGDITEFSGELLRANDIDSSVMNDLRLPQLLSCPSTAMITVCSVTGSFLSQAVVTAISSKGDPLESIFVFNGDDYVARSMSLSQ